MFSYLRPHKRTPSNPTSPIPDAGRDDHGHAHPRTYQDRLLGGELSPPPILPPIARVSSGNSEVDAKRQWHIQEREHELRERNGVAMRELRGQSYTNHPRIPLIGSEKRPESAGNAGPSSYTQPEKATRPKLPSPEAKSWSGTAPDNRPMMPGRRATGARLPTPPPGANTAEPVVVKSKRMNLLNPMSLLARRRTSQAVAQLNAESLVTNRSGHAASTSYSGIRGTVIHDFSAPRPRRVESMPAVEKSAAARRKSPGGDGEWSAGHTPVFTEDFEEEQYPAAGPHVRKASDLGDLTIPKLPYAKGAQRPMEAGQSPPKVADVERLQQQENVRMESPSGPPPPVPPKSAERAASSGRVSIDPNTAPARTISSMKSGRPRGASEVSAKDSAGFALPKHMKSTSSRFSFDMIGAAEQERLLEDRHRQRALEKQGADGETRDEEDVYNEEYDYDNMDDDGMEEDIPMVGDDYDEYPEEAIPMTGDDSHVPGALDDQVNISRFTFMQPLASPLSPNTPGTISTPRDANGEVIGFAMTKNSPYPSMDAAHDDLEGESPASSISTDQEAYALNSGFQGLGLHEFGTNSANSAFSPIAEGRESEDLEREEHREFPNVTGLDDDDLYFDDGLIDEIGDAPAGVGADFDESVFDAVDTDQYGRPLKPFSSMPTLYAPPNLAANPLPSTVKSIDETDDPTTTTDDIDIPASTVVKGGLAPKASVIGKPLSDSTLQAAGLTQDSLAAYQSALAAAAFNAAANGKFRRDSTPEVTTSSSNENPLNTQQYEQPPHQYSPYDDEEDDFDYDDALEDDDVIAAANAEALAYDTEGWYGQEFGFYSAPANPLQTQYANGGYFGTPTAAVIRSRSGRLADREANLTPITERSEYSNRNSFMFSPGLRPESLASPGLSSLAGLRSPGAPFGEGDMSLDALLRLRRGAWGGSQVSLHSDKSNGGSPKSAVGAEDSLPQAGGGHRRVNSAFSLASEAQSSFPPTENNSPPESPTITLASFLHQNPQSLQVIPPVPQVHVEGGNKENEGLGMGMGGLSSELGGKGKDVAAKHRHSKSSDSVSYMKEEDPGSPTGERWVLERRRMSESGVEEVLGREVVSGGRI